VLRICVALKNPLASAGIEPPNLGSNGKDAIHSTTEDEVVLCYYFVCSGLHQPPVERFFKQSKRFEARRSGKARTMESGKIGVTPFYLNTEEDPDFET
jgi:hypothetical protein